MYLKEQKSANKLTASATFVEISLLELWQVFKFPSIKIKIHVSALNVLTVCSQLYT